MVEGGLARFSLPIFGGQRGGRDVEEGGPADGGHSLGQHRLACPRGPEHQHALHAHVSSYRSMLGPVLADAAKLEDLSPGHVV